MQTRTYTPAQEGYSSPHSMEFSSHGSKNMTVYGCHSDQDKPFRDGQLEVIKAIHGVSWILQDTVHGNPAPTKPSL